jgi:kynurenine formamidase
VPRFVDLSAPIATSPPDVGDFQRTDVSFSDHAEGAAQIREMFGVPAELLRDGEGWANDSIDRLGTHNSTHVDAPRHYNSTIAGEPAKAIDELPLDWYHRPGVVLDVRGNADGEAVTVAQVGSELARIGHELAPRDIVLVRSGRDAFYGDADYITRGPGVTAEATRWLHDRGVRVMGIDAWGWDRPLQMQAADAVRERRPGIFWAAHQVDLEYSQIERLCNLGELPATGFTVSCFPLRIVGASAAPARVVGIVPDDA